jgi:hypothetical protein
MITFISLGPAAPKESNDRPVASLFLTIAKFPVVVPKQNNNAEASFTHLPSAGNAIFALQTCKLEKGGHCPQSIYGRQHIQCQAPHLGVQYSYTKDDCCVRIST